MSDAPVLLRKGPVSETWRLHDRYEKRYRVLWPWLPLAGLLKGNVPALDARVEAANAERLLALGVAAPRPVATSSRGRLSPLGLVHETTVGLAPLAGASLEDITGSVDPDSERARIRIARLVGDAVRRMHRARIFHRDLYLCHLVWDGERVGVLDVARARPTRLFAARRRVKDLAALLASALAAQGASPREQMAFLRAYAGPGRIDRALVEETRRRARRMMTRVRGR